MEKIKLGENLEFSRLIHGNMRLVEWNMSSNDLLNLIEQCIDLGITTFDHADIYGDYQSEELFGEALKLKPELRKNIQIIDKCGIKLKSSRRPDHKIKYYDTSEDHIIKSVENSLKNIKTDYIDLLLIHRPDPFMNPEEVSEAFRKLKKEGKVLNFGVSNFKPSQFNMLSEYVDGPLVTNQIEVSPLNLENFDNGSIELCQEKGIHPIAWSPLAGGRIFSPSDDRTKAVHNTLKEIGSQIGVDSISQIIYAWILNHPVNIMPIIGSGKIERIKDAVQSLDIKLTRQQWFEIWQASTGREVD